MEATYVDNISTENTGGDVMVDVITLKSGKVITVTDESVVLWPSIEEWRNSGDPLDAMWMV